MAHIANDLRNIVNSTVEKAQWFASESITGVWVCHGAGSPRVRAACRQRECRVRAMGISRDPR